jgi:hypothetical protein
VIPGGQWPGAAPSIQITLEPLPHDPDEARLRLDRIPRSDCGCGAPAER